MKAIRTLFLTLAAAVIGLAADPALLRLLPADADFLAGINASQVRTSRFGQFVLDQLKSEEDSMNKFISATGFDPRKDLVELVVAGKDNKLSAHKMLVLAKGRFDSNRIQNFAQTEGSGVETYNGFLVMTGKGKNSGWLTVLDGSTAAAGDVNSVKYAIDHFRQSGASALDPKLANKIADLSTKYDAWMIGTGLSRLADDLRDPNVGGAMQNNLFKSMEGITGGVRFGSNVELTAEATMRSEKDATAMVDVVKFLAGMLQLNSNNDKKAAELAGLLDKMELKSSGNLFHLSITIPEGVLEGLVKPASNQKKSPII